MTNIVINKDRAHEIYNRAHRDLALEDFTYWLCYAYGAMANDVSAETLELIEENLNLRQNRVK